MPNKKLLICLLLLIVGFITVSLAFADESANLESANLESCDLDFNAKAIEMNLAAYCPYSEEGSDEIKQLMTFANEEKVKFNEFIESHFLNKEQNSELIETAFAKYHEIEDKIFEKQNLVFAKMEATGCTKQEIFTAFLECQDAASDLLNRMYANLKDHIKSTANVKRTTILLNKYKEINGKLRDLNEKMTETYGYYLTFSKKFQGYVPKCE